MNSKVKISLLAFGIPTLYAVLLRLFFGIDTWENLFVVMSVSFLFLLPMIMGILTTFLSPVEKITKITYLIFAPWIPVGLFLVITLAFAIEGWACWIMALPLFLILASVGGFIGAFIKSKQINKTLNLSLLFLLPFLISPIEQAIEKIPSTYQAYTYIDIKAQRETIWQNVTRVPEIKQEEDKGYISRFLGFPRPVKAELNYTGLGASREAIFTKGLIFNEKVIEYEDNKKMTFSIKANTFDIPSTTLDEHILIGGDYFDVLTGTYELEKLSEGFFRLHLYSHFKMNTGFNFYAGWWGKWIMKDIQRNILQIEKKRAENPKL